VHSSIESGLSDNIESCYSSLSQFCCRYKVAFTKDRVVVNTNDCVSIWNDLNVNL